MTWQKKKESWSVGTSDCRFHGKGAADLDLAARAAGLV